jgi:hypothetical protein
MGLMDQARADIEQITSDENGWGTEMVFTAPTDETATIFGIFVEHHTTFNPEGVNTNAKFTHCSFSERLLTVEGYPTRDDNDEVDFSNHKVVIKGKKYVIREWKPDETVGLISCSLGDFDE